MAEGRFALGGSRVFTLLAYGIMLLWGGLLVAAVGGPEYVGRAGHLLAVSGALFAALMAVAGALGIPETSDMQNLGLLVLGSALILSAALVIGL